MWTDRRWVMIGVGTSLLLNIFLVGCLVGYAFGGHRPPPAGGAARPNPGALVPAERVRALPKDERTLFYAAMSTHREAIRSAHQTQQHLRQAVAEDIAAPTFDHDKVAADFKALRDNAAAIQQTTQDGLLDALAQLSQTSRAMLVAHGPLDGDHH